MPRRILDDEEVRFVAGARIARLATSTTDGVPHIVPVCFALLADSIYIGLDAKPKSVDVLKLRRVRNIVSNPRAAFIVDQYSDEWSRLGYVLIHADAILVTEDHERANAIAALRRKYVQYRTLLFDDAHVIGLRPRSVTSWGELAPWASAHDVEVQDSTHEEAST